MTREPVFVHSLFRAGSTYVFEVFRRSPAGYHCFQEPMHEAAWLARQRPALLLEHDDERTRRLLRHPPLSGGYFTELHGAWPAWRDALKQHHLYDAYFAAPGTDAGQAFWQALAAASPGRPVFQDCRSSGRMAALKAALGGVHLYLWRNPWDQWWSYKVSPYFDHTTQFFLHARGAPGVLRVLRQRWQLKAPPTDVMSGFAHFERHPMGDTASYQAFYALWCLALRAGWEQAHLLLNIDQLSDTAARRSDALAQLARLGLDGLDLTNCRVPQHRYTQQERDFFARQERAVHEDLARDGWSGADLAQLDALRQAARPRIWQHGEPGFEAQALADQQQRLAELAARRPAPAHRPAGLGLTLRRWLGQPWRSLPSR